MKLLGNIIWFVFGGVLMGLSWCFLGLIAFITIIGIPWGKACFTIGVFSFWPFGKEVVKRKDIGHDDIGTGILGKIGNVVWVVIAGFWLAIGHTLSAAITAITIIGIPFAIQHMKLAKLAFAPIGKMVVEKGTADNTQSINV